MDKNTIVKFIFNLSNKVLLVKINYKQNKNDEKFFIFILFV